MYSFWLLIWQDQSTGYAATYLPDTPEMIIPHRVGNVHVDYLSGKNWEKRAAAEATGFAFDTTGGILAGQAVCHILRA